ncbi:MAG TPA: hypothetical protein DEQ34_01990 [Balneolaceae bacterium]|nr:hypothetical protein [Balneolaceae bacterium]
MTDKKFSEDAVRQIIRLAMEKEKALEESANDQHGLTIEELISIGKDVGLSEEEIRAAAKKYSANSVKSFFKVTNTEIIEERTFTSTLAKEELWEHLQFELDDHYGQSTIFGNLASAPRDYQWNHTSSSGVITKATLRSEGEGYRFRISQQVGMANPFWEGISIGILPTIVIFAIYVAVTSVSSWILNSLVATGIWALSSYITYKLDTKWRAKKLRLLKEFANNLMHRIPQAEVKDGVKNQSVNSAGAAIEIESPEVYPDSESVGQIKESKRQKE